jgi:hemoglobin
MSQNDRRARITAEIVSNTGIDEELIHRLVHTFYSRVRKDTVLAPVFDSYINDWDAHLEKMCAFWSSVALLTGRYHGRPMEKHLPLPIDAHDFDRWLSLFEDTVKLLCEPDAADHFIERARRIAESLEMGIASQAGVLLAKGERYISDDLRTSAAAE